jgi:ribosomal protein S5
MAEKTIVDKAGETVGVGIAMSSDVEGAIKTAFGAAVTTVSEVLKQAPARRVTARTTAKNHLSRRPRKKP